MKRIVLVFSMLMLSLGLLSQTYSKNGFRVGKPSLYSRVLSETDLPYHKADHYVATWGSDADAGTFNNPWLTWQKAADNVSAGDTVYIRGGTYYFDDDAEYAAFNLTGVNGTAVAPICIFNYPGEIPILDVTGHQNASDIGVGIYLNNCDYWVFKGLTVTGAEQNVATDVARGFHTILCNTITFENCVAHDLEGCGFTVDYCDGDINIINCDAYNLYDLNSTTPGNNADGFVTLSTDETHIVNLLNCRAWSCSDDGYDFTYEDGIVTIDHCWGFQNGLYTKRAGSGNGFKLGEGETVDAFTVTRRKFYNCIASHNFYCGFNQNGAISKMVLYNNIAYDNARGIYLGTTTNATTVSNNNIAYSNSSYNYIAGDNTNASADHNSWQGGLTVNAADFISLDTLELYRPRKIEIYTDNSEKWLLPEVDFFELAQTSDLIEAGIDVSLAYSGNRPDIGAFETTKTLQVIREAYTATSDGLTTGIIYPMTQNITVTSASANNICCLPLASASTIGTIITGTVGANGFELRVAASQATTVYLNNVTTNVEAAIPASTNFRVTQIDATHWVLECTTALGAVLTAIIPDAV